MNTKLIFAIALTVVFSAGCEPRKNNKQLTDAEINDLQDYILLNPDKPRENKDFTIAFQVSGNEDKLEVTSPNLDNCKNKGSKTGCFRIKKLKTGLITFKFTDEDNKWALQQFTVCRGETPVTDSCTNDLTLDERLEFIVMNDATGSKTLFTPASGEVDLTQLQLPAGSSTFYLFDQNTIKQTYYYNIKACRIDEEKNAGEDVKQCLTFIDPPVENKGLK